MQNKIVTIDLLRHGETETQQKFIGSTDVALSEQGFLQMQQALLNSPLYTGLFSSPLRRCAIFAEDYAVDKGLTVSLETQLKEYHFGDWEDCLTKDIWQQQPQAFSQFWDDPQLYPPPQAEDLLVFKRRIDAVLMSCIEQAKNDHLLLVTHGGVIRCYLALLLDMPLSKMSCLQIDYASLSRVVIYVENGKITPSISFVNQRVSL